MFASQLAFLRSRYEPVSGAEVAASLHGGPPLPRNAVWITFDDGYRSVVELGLPLLEMHEITATMFVCPGLVSEHRPTWFDIARAPSLKPTLDRMMGGPSELAMTRLKCMEDGDRRRMIDQLTNELSAGELESLARRLAGSKELHHWVTRGQELGNHTWDHPILPRTSAESATEQIDSAHRWLEDESLMTTPPLFAYPNGDEDDRCRGPLSRLGYGVAVLFDHRLNQRVIDPQRISRLRVSSSASIARLDAILSGAHSGLFHASRPIARFRPGGSSSRPESGVVT